ncbi:MAG: hypothetical protein KC448_05080 [Yoonia sp.]|nr:hypothetical protein [Yoonia sp.]
MFPYEEASWSVVDGPMYMLANTSAPGWFTFIAAVICVAVLVIGQKSEAEKTKRFDE